MKKTIYQIAKELDVQEGTVRIWLSNYRFNKYRLIGKPLSYDVTKTMLNELEQYLTNKGKRVKSTLWNLKWMRSHC